MQRKDLEYTRRDIIKKVLIGGAMATVVLPGKWTKPLINSIVVPAHAQASPPATTTPEPLTTLPHQ